MSDCGTCLPLDCDSLVNDDSRLYSLQRVLFPFVANCPEGQNCDGALTLTLQCCNTQITVSFPGGSSLSDKLAIIQRAVNQCVLLNAGCGEGNKDITIPPDQGQTLGPTAPTSPPTTQTQKLILYYNHRLIRRSTCPGGAVFQFTVPAGAFAAPTQAQADNQAAAFANDAVSTLKAFCPQENWSSIFLCNGVAAYLPITCVNGQEPISWSVSAGTLPTGLSLLQNSGRTVAIGGTPTVNGTFNFTLTATDLINQRFDFNTALVVNGFTVTMSSTPDMGTANGTATATPSEAGTYTYLWSPGGQTTQTATGLTPGTYGCAVTNTATTCTASGSIAVSSSMDYIVNTTNETVVSGVGQSDGTITFHITGGTGPYTLHNLDGYGDVSGAGPDLGFTGLPGALTYTFYITDSGGNILPLDYPSSVISVPLKRDAFDWSFTVSGSKGSTSFPGGDLSVGPVVPMALFSAADQTISASCVLTSVDFTLTSGTLFNNYAVTNSAAPTSHHYALTTSSLMGLTVQSVQRVSGTCSRPTTSGNTTSASVGVAGPTASSIGPITTNASDGTTLAACTGVGSLTLLFTAVHPVINTAGSDAQIGATLSGVTYSFQSQVTYNYHCPEE